MKCPHCQEEVSESGFLYCPHCGKKLKSGKKGEKGLLRRSVVVGSILTWAILTGVCFWLDKLDEAMMRVGYGLEATLEPIPGNPPTWAPNASIVIALAILYVLSVCIIYNHAKRHKRNAVAWATAAAAFSPVLAGIAYGLTWPKGKQ